MTDIPSDIQRNAERRFGKIPPQRRIFHSEALWQAAYADAISALRYIRFRYGNLDGVGWERIENTAKTMQGKN